MAEIGPGLINSNGHGKYVPREMDRNIVKFVIDRRKNAIEADPDLLQTERWDHSDVFYAARTWLNQHGWDTSVYSDNVSGGADRRKNLYDMIKPVCEDYYHVKRHQIGIYPDDRAVMTYGGVMYAASFDNLGRLMYSGTEVICVEKGGTVVKMMPFTRNNGVAFIQSQGFISEYGIALARIANGDHEITNNYLLDREPIGWTCNLGNLTDCDSSGMVIGMKVKGATRLGIDLDTIDEINQVNKELEDELGIDLPIELEDLEESNKINSHWKGLNGIVNRTGKLYESLSTNERDFYRRLLLSRPAILGGNERYIDYLEERRIELNTVLAIIKPQAFWNWLKWKLLQTWPSRNYLRGGLMLADDIRTPTMNRFTNFYDRHTKSITESRLIEERSGMWKVDGVYDDTDGFMDNTKIVKKAIIGDVMNEVVLPDKRVQEIDLALEKIMQDGNDNGGGRTRKQKRKSTKSDNDDSEQYDDNYDGNEWSDHDNEEEA